MAEEKALIAKQNIYAEVDDGDGVKVKRLVAVEGQEVPRAFRDLVDSKQVTSEQPKTRLDRSTTSRRRERERQEPDHAEARAAAAAVPAQDAADAPTDGEADAPVDEEKPPRKSRRKGQNKARSGGDGDK